MTTTTESDTKELKDLILILREDIKRVEIGQGEIRSDLKRLEADVKRIEIGQARLEERLTGQMQALDQRLTGQIQTLDERLTGEIKTVNAKLDGLSKRLENQEFLSRSVVAGLILAFVAGLVKLFFPEFPSKP